MISSLDCDRKRLLTLSFNDFNDSFCDNLPPEVASTLVLEVDKGADMGSSGVTVFLLLLLFIRLLLVLNGFVVLLLDK